MAPPPLGSEITGGDKPFSPFSGDLDSLSTSKKSEKFHYR
jgi:hypothetical protein